MLVYETEHIQLHATANSKILDLILNWKYHKCFIVNSELIALLLITLGIYDSSLTDPRDTLIKMAFIKEESEDLKIEEAFRVKHEDTEEQRKIIKEESEDMKSEEAFRVKHEDTEEQTGWFSF